MKKCLGFSLIELVITIAIVGILVSLALPAYNNHFKRSKFTEVVLASNAVQKKIEICFYIKNNISECNTFEKISSKKSEFIEPTFVSNVELLNSSGTVQIKSTATTEASISSTGDTYIMTARIKSNKLLWSLSSNSSCISVGTC